MKTWKEIAYDPLFWDKVAVGQIKGARDERLWGKCAPSTSFVDIWPQASVRTLPTVAVKFGFSSASANDTSAGTGARTIVATMLDSNFQEIEETITLNGQTKVESSGLYLRLQKMVVKTAGSGGVNAGIIYAYDTSDTVSGGVPQTASKIFGHMAAGDNITQMGMYTVPVGKRLFLRRICISQYDTAARYARVRMWYWKSSETVRKYLDLRGVCTTATTFTQIMFDVPIMFEAGTDFGFQCLGSAAGSTILLKAECALVDED